MSALPGLPALIPSNLTAPEFERLLYLADVPAYVRERFDELARMEGEEIGQAICEKEEAESELADCLRTLRATSDALDQLRAKWDALMGRLDSADEEAPVDILDVEKALCNVESEIEQ